MLLFGFWWRMSSVQCVGSSESVVYLYWLATTIGTLDDELSDDDGFLYIKISGDSFFG